MDNETQDLFEKQLIKRLKGGDVTAFEIIYRKQYNHLVNFALNFTIYREDAEEIAQDALFNLWKKRKDIKVEKPVEPLLFVITKNLVINKIKKYVAERRRLKYFLILHDFTLQNTSTEQKISFDELKVILEMLIEQLPPKRKEIFKLNREKGLSYTDIARHLHISVGTVEKQMSSALKYLKEKLPAIYQSGVKLVMTILAVVSAFKD